QGGQRNRGQLSARAVDHGHLTATSVTFADLMVPLGTVHTWAGFVGCGATHGVRVRKQPRAPGWARRRPLRSASSGDLDRAGEPLERRLAGCRSWSMISWV